MEFSWDADNAPEKKLALDASLISSPANPGHAEIHGNIVFAGEPYHAKLVLTAANLIEHMEGENGFKLILTTPTQKTIVLGASCDVQLAGATTKVISTVEYKNTKDRKYRYASVIAMEKLGGPHNYAVEAKVTYKQPGTP